MVTRHETGAWSQRHFICIGLIVVGLAAFVCSAIVDIDYWVSVAKTERGKWEWGASSVIFQLIVLLFAAVVGNALRARKWLGAIPGSIVLLLYMTYNMGSVIGFGARERIAPAQAATISQQRNDDAVSEANAQQEKLRSEHITYLRGKVDEADRQLKGAMTKEQRAVVTTARQDSLSELGSAAFRDVEIKVAPIETAMVDPQAEFLAMFLPFTVVTIQLIMNAAWGAGLILGKIVCWTFAFALWPAAEIPVSKAGTRVASSREDDEPEEEVDLAADAYLEPIEEIVSHPANTNLMSLDARRAEVAAKDRELLEHVRRFYAEATRPLPGNRVKSTPVNAHYNKWAELRGAPYMSINPFGRFSTDLGLHRDRGKRTWAYLDIELIPLGRGSVAQAKAA